MGCFRIYGYRKSEMLKKFQHDSDIAKVSIFDYGLRSLLLWLQFLVDLKRNSSADETRHSRGTYRQ